MLMQHVLISNLCVSARVCLCVSQAKSHAKRGIRDIKGRLKARVSSTYRPTSDTRRCHHPNTPLHLITHTKSEKQTGKALPTENWVLTRQHLMKAEACLELCSSQYIFNQRPSGYGLSCHQSLGLSSSFIVCIFHQRACDFLKANVMRCMFP